MEAGVILKIFNRDFLSGPVFKNPPSNAGDVGSIPGPGAKLLHVVGQLSLPWNYEPMCSGARALQQEACAISEDSAATKRKKEKKKLTAS